MNKDKNKMASWSIVVLAAAALISTIVLFAPVNAGVSPAVGRSIGDAANGTIAIIGETNLSFVDESGVLINNGTTIVNIKGPSEDTSEAKKNSVDIDFVGTFDTTKYDDSGEIDNPLVPGTYNVSGGNKSTTIEFKRPRLIAKTDKSDVIRGDTLTFEANTNLFRINRSAGPNYITFRLTDPNGHEKTMVGVISLENVNVNITGINTTTIDTGDLVDFGEYTVCIKPDPDTNNGLGEDEKYKCGPPVTFEVISGVSLTAAKTEAKVTEEIKFTVTTASNTSVSLTVTSGDESKVWFVGGKEDVQETGHNCTGMTDDDGIFEAVAEFTGTGAYKITATEFIGYDTSDVWVKIERYDVTLEEPEEGVYYIGKELTIKGDAPDTGDNVTIKAAGALIKTISVSEFEEGYPWKTEGMAPGTYKIAIWVSPFSNPEIDLPDASVTIVLLRGGLSAKTSTDFVAIGDYFEIEKVTAPGRDRVDILTIAPKGGSGRGFDPLDILTETGKLDAPGLTYCTYSKNPVDDEFTEDVMEKIGVGVNVDTGTYSIAVLNYGRDKKWGTSGNDNLLEVISNTYTTSLATKTTEQILAILKDKTINAAGSDDLFCMATIKVENGFVTLNKIEDVQLGKNIEVTGITNRKVGTSIIVTVEGLEDNAVKLKPKFATVEKDDKNFYNKFSVSLATEAAKIGDYVVTADDGDEHTDTTTVNIVPAATPSVNVSNSSTPTAAGIQAQGTNENANAKLQMAMSTPTPTSTPTETETETKKTPGFETIFTITVVLAVARLVVMYPALKGEACRRGMPLRD